MSLVNKTLFKCILCNLVFFFIKKKKKNVKSFCDVVYGKWEYLVIIKDDFFVNSA